MLRSSWTRGTREGLLLALVASLALGTGCGGDDDGGEDMDAGLDSAVQQDGSVETDATVITACSENPCQNGGGCFSMGTTAFLCQCVNGYTGNVCETAPEPAVSGWGNDGLAQYTSGVGNDRGRAVIALPNNETFIVGSSEPVLGNVSIMAMRLDATGHPVAAFDTDGVYVNDLGTVDDALFAADLSDDGTLVAAVGNSGGTGTRDSALFLYDLSANTVFSASVALHPTLDNRLHAVTIATVGGTEYVYGAGYRHVDATNTEYVVARFTTAGALDTTFNGDGIVAFDLSAARSLTGTTVEQAKGISVLANGDIVIAGEADQASDTDIALVKILAPGATDGPAVLDPAFGADADMADGPDGYVIVSFGPGAGNTRDNLYSMSADSTGRFVLFGSRAGVSFTTPACMTMGCVTDPGTPTTTRQRIVARVLANGAGWDPTFKNFETQPTTGLYQRPGLVPLTLGSISLDSRIGSIDADGKILSAGYGSIPTGVGTQSENTVILFRLGVNGAIDTTFGVGGAVVSNPFSAPYPTRWGMCEAYGAAQRTDGSYVTTGYARLAGQTSMDKVRMGSLRFSASGVRYTTTGF